MVGTTDSPIHPTACIADGAVIGDGVRIGPYAVVEDDVVVGAGTEVGPHCVLRRWTRLGERNTLASHVVLGEAPQHRRYGGQETWLEIGDDNVIREAATINRAYEPGAVTRVGSSCYIMGYAHIAHDCVIGDEVTITNYVALAGHVEVGDYVTIGGGAMVHQFVRIGAYAMLGGMTGVRKDILPFTLASENPCRHYRLNSVGLRRRGIEGERYRQLERAMRVLRSGEALPDAQADESDDVRLLRQFIATSTRGVSAWAGKR